MRGGVARQVQADRADELLQQRLEVVGHASWEAEPPRHALAAVVAQNGEVNHGVVSLSLRGESTAAAGGMGKLTNGGE
eukprot:984731-Pyramimonas_sp.AAC.1